jgi:hypothetical protein
MASVAVQRSSGTYRVLQKPSSLAFAVRRSGVFWDRRGHFCAQGEKKAMTDETRARTLAGRSTREVR